ncbi:MAG: hypothetical protein Q4G04_03625 [bacterium]|nr:hypothetical protein [bacterium]
MNFIEFLIGLIPLWASSTLLCLGADIANELRLIKTVADEGYVLDINKISLDISYGKLLIPVYHFIHIAKKIINDNYYSSIDIKNLINHELVEEMDEIEKEYYNASPTVFRAIKISRFKKETITNIDNHNKPIIIVWDKEKVHLQITLQEIKVLNLVELKESITPKKLEEILLLSLQPLIKNKIISISYEAFNAQIDTIIAEYTTLFNSQAKYSYTNKKINQLPESNQTKVKKKTKK